MGPPAWPADRFLLLREWTPRDHQLQRSPRERRVCKRSWPQMPWSPMSRPPMSWPPMSNVLCRRRPR
jgi:hypothetical protein